MNYIFSFQFILVKSSCRYYRRLYITPYLIYIAWINENSGMDPTSSGQGLDPTGLQRGYIYPNFLVKNIRIWTIRSTWESLNHLFKVFQTIIHSEKY